MIDFTLGERIAWARAQHDLTLQQVADRSGLNVGYLSQLENGSKVNPSLHTLRRLAPSLDVNVAFITGDIGMPNEDAWQIGRRFAQYLRHCSVDELETLTCQTVEERCHYVVTFLCSSYRDLHTPTTLAFKVGISVRSLHEIMAGTIEISYVVLQRLSALTAIPIAFFMGQIGLSPDWYGISPNDVLLYMEPVFEAVELNMTPRQVSTAIQQYVRKSPPNLRGTIGQGEMTRCSFVQ